MGIFKEREGYIDYTLLKKKGLLKIPEEKNEIIDFTTAITQPTPPVSQLEPANPFGFLDAIPSASSTSPSVYENENSKNILPEANLNSLKIKIEDLEYKLERFLEKLTLIESKIYAFESKLKS